VGCLVGGDRVGSGARSTDRATHPDLAQDGDELRAVGGLSLGERERQGAAAPVGSAVPVRMRLSVSATKSTVTAAPSTSSLIGTVTALSNPRPRPARETFTAAPGRAVPG